jgi:putative SOS response-associated peptidase YedK
MCGRFTNEMTWAEIYALYSIHDRRPPASNMQPRYNIAPTDDVQIVHLDREGNREFDTARWWLLPFWAKEPTKAAMFNARIETIAEAPAFRDAFKSKRCLIPADGYFEWTTGPDGGKDPWLLQLPEGTGFSFAGLWAYNSKVSIPADAPPGVTSCTIITAPAVPRLQQIHNRMPLILAESAYKAWLDPATDTKTALSLLVENEMDSQLIFHRVGREVNNSRYEGTDTKKPIINAL